MENIFNKNKLRKLKKYLVRNEDEVSEIIKNNVVTAFNYIKGESIRDYNKLHRVKVLLFFDDNDIIVDYMNKSLDMYKSLEEMYEEINNRFNGCVYFVFQILMVYTFDKMNEFDRYERLIRRITKIIESK